jgi:nicotinate dehydrogenase subunit A
VIALQVDGRRHEVDADPATPLLHVLAGDLQLRGPKLGCGMAQCGSCTVLVDGRAVRSCAMRVKDAAGKQVTTLEGLGTPERPHPLQQAFIDEQAVQCGFCLSGVILTAKALLDRNPDPTDEELRWELSGILCRCFAHGRMLRAIRRYAAQLRSSR